VDAIPTSALQPFVDAVAAQGLTVETAVHPTPGPMAGVHWLLPTAAVLYFAKSYFDGFLKEAGKDHYELLKKGVGLLWTQFFGDDRSFRMTLVGSSGKIRADDNYSVALSLMADAGPGLTFKLLIPDDCGVEEFTGLISMFLAFLSDYYAGSVDASTQRRLTNAPLRGRVIPMAYDRRSGQFIFLDPVRK